LQPASRKIRPLFSLMLDLQIFNLNDWSMRKFSFLTTSTFVRQERPHKGASLAVRVLSVHFMAVFTKEKFSVAKAIRNRLNGCGNINTSFRRPFKSSQATFILSTEKTTWSKYTKTEIATWLDACGRNELTGSTLADDGDELSLKSRIWGWKDKHLCQQHNWTDLVIKCSIHDSSLLSPPPNWRYWLQIRLQSQLTRCGQTGNSHGLMTDFYVY
jgi:hypothetical protein